MSSFGRGDATRDAFTPADVSSTCYMAGSLGQFDIGYDFVRTKANGLVVQGLEPGSNAAIAGLKNGDLIKKGWPATCCSFTRIAT